ncbi:hypothetical protein MtrunA17_Chr8g0339321 [Medicago truncatula]|uniref:Uncharacterized protein n=1 Tax=Medicago truncatula TaxID=3880 RepID=A0A396GK41_MEDTR|nr:hypothetical protein MtrunA17_Chr8g0339321 [Medicago truncatula]
MKSYFSFDLLSISTSCSSTQLPTTASKSLAILFIDFSTFPSKPNQPRIGIKSLGTNSPEICINSFISFTIFPCASTSSTSFKYSKYLFPQIIFVIILNVNLSNHSLITTLTFPTLTYNDKSFIKVSISDS